MTQSNLFNFGDYLTNISTTDTITLDGGYVHKQQTSPREVIIVNTSEVNLYLGDEFVYEDNDGITVFPGAGISLSLGSSDELYGWADGEITLPVMILAGKGR